MLEPKKPGLDVGLLVRDPGPCLEFYRDLLGFEYLGQTRLPHGTLHRLRWGTSDLKLVEPMKPVPAGPAGHRNQLGFRYLTLVIEDMAHCCQELTAKGVEFAEPPREIRPGVKVAFMLDPEGNTVELQEVS